MTHTPPGHPSELGNDETSPVISRRTSLAALAMGVMLPIRDGDANDRLGSNPYDITEHKNHSSSASIGAIRNLLDALTPAEQADAISGSPTINLTEKINAFLTEHSHVEITDGTFLVDHLNIPATLVSLRALTKSTLTFKRSGAGVGAMFRCSAERNTHAVVEGIYLFGNGNDDETCGFDLTGFSYATFLNCRARAFRRDGWYSRGLITPINRQVSNNTFINCIGNDNGRDGIRLEGESSLLYENTDNIFIGGEFSGNKENGINGVTCESTQFYGTCAQSNRIRDIYFNSRYCIFHGYIESGPKGVEMGPKSYGCRVATRSSYPRWNTFIDNGEANQLSILGEVAPERHLFSNPYFNDWIGSTPTGIELKGAPVVSSYLDQSSPFGAGLQIAITANFQGLIFSLLSSASEMRGKWATLLIELDTSEIADPLEMRVYSRDGQEPNSQSGQFAIESLPATAPGHFKTLAYDVKFPTPLVGTPTIAWFPAYGGVRARRNIIKIRSVRIISGQSCGVGWPQTDLAQSISATRSELESVNYGINIHRKRAGKTVYDSTSQKLRYALSGNPAGAWRATDGSGDLIPS